MTAAEPCLKRLPRIAGHLERAVEAGTYRTDEEFEAAKNNIVKAILKPRVPQMGL
jgi:hypothetical protein